MNKLVAPLAFVVLLSACSSNKDPKEQGPIKTAGKSWIGTWERKQNLSDAELDIKSVKSDSIEFSLSAANGGNSGELEGTAIVNDSMAVYLDKDKTDSCLIHFVLLGDSVIKINQLSGICGAGNGVFYGGVYKNARLLPKAKEETKNLVDLGIFKTSKEDSVFRLLVGDSYKLFASTTQQTSEGDDLDSLHANVYASGINGLFTIAENIIMIDSSHNIWSAVIDKEKLYYFTNASRYKDSLPKTIHNWRQRFKDYKIVYKH